MKPLETWPWAKLQTCLPSPLQHHSATRRQDNKRLRHSGAPSDAPGAAQVVGGPQHPGAAAAQPSFVPPAGRQLCPADRGQRRPRAVVYLGLAAVTHTALVVTVGQSQEWEW